LSHKVVRGLSLAGALFAAPQLALAGDDIRASADVTTAGGYSSNPFAETGSKLGSAYAQITAAPEVRFIAERSLFTLDGRINYQHYFHDYSDTSDYQGGLDYLGRPTERLTTHAKIVYDSSITGGLDALGSLIDSGQPLPPATTGPDLALFGSRLRRRSLHGAGDMAYRLSARDNLTLNAFYDVLRYSSFAEQSNYDGYGGGIGYSHRMSGRLRLGLQASVGRYVYQGPLGHTQVYSLQATINDDFSDHWNLSGSLGGSTYDRTIGGRSTSPAGNLQLCRTTTRAKLCAMVSESVLPTGFTGTVVSTSAGASYSYRLTEHGRFSLAANYARNSRPATNIALNNIAIASRYVTATATYDRTLRERLHFLVMARYRDIIGQPGNHLSDFGHPADFGGSIGFSVRLGDYK